jgi:hypothetical protein
MDTYTPEIFSNADQLEISVIHSRGSPLLTAAVFAKTIGMVGKSKTRKLRAESAARARQARAVSLLIL